MNMVEKALANASAFSYKQGTDRIFIVFLFFPVCNF